MAGGKNLKKNNISFFYFLLLETGEGREKERERKIDWLPPTHPQPGTRLACALTRYRTGNLSVCGMMPNPLSHTCQGSAVLLEP